MSNIDIHPPLTFSVSGGSAFDQTDSIGLNPIQSVTLASIHTPFDKDTWAMGFPSELRIFQIGDVRFALVNRHGWGHVIPPHLVPARPIIYAMRQLQSRIHIIFCLGGSLNPEIKPDTFVILSQFVDRTSGRPDTFFDQPNLVCHIPGSDPYCQTGSELMAQAIIRAMTGFKLHRQKTAVVIQGPRFSTRAESQIFQSWGCDVVCMAPYPESILALEAGMCVLCVVYISDGDVGDEQTEPVDVAAVQKNSQGLPSKIGDILIEFAELLQTSDNRGYLIDCHCRHLIAKARQSEAGAMGTKQRELWKLFTSR